jgi:hypothetical protein
MPELLAALHPFLQEHRRCGELEALLDSRPKGGLVMTDARSAARTSNNPSTARANDARTAGQCGRAT